MRIALKNGSVTYWLAGKPGVSEREFSSVSEFSILPVITVQEDRRVRAAAARVLDRGNTLTTIGWTTSRLFHTADAAEKFCTDYEADFPRTGTLILVSRMAGGGTRERYLPAAVVEPPQRRATGLTVILTYTARGGALTAVNPTP